MFVYYAIPDVKNNRQILNNENKCKPRVDTGPTLTGAKLNWGQNNKYVAKIARVDTGPTPTGANFNFVQNIE